MMPCAINVTRPKAGWVIPDFSRATTKTLPHFTVMKKLKMMIHCDVTYKRDEKLCKFGRNVRKEAGLKKFAFTGVTVAKT